MKHKTWFTTVSTLIVLLVSLTACSDTKPEENKKDVVETSLLSIQDNIFSFNIVNNSKEDIVHDFSSGQRFDFSLSANGEVIHQLSAVSMYTQELGKETIKAGETLSYEFEVPVDSLQSGEYLLKAWLTPSEGTKYETEVEYAIKK